MKLLNLLIIVLHQYQHLSITALPIVTHQTQPPSYGFCKSYFTSLPLKYVQTLASMENNENCVKLIMIGPAQWFKGNITLFLKNVTGLHNSKKNDKKQSRNCCTHKNCPLDSVWPPKLSQIWCGHQKHRSSINSTLDKISIVVNIMPLILTCANSLKF